MIVPAAALRRQLELLLGLVMPFIFTFIVATIRSRRRKADEEVIISVIQGAA